MPKPPARFLQRFSDPEIEEREPGDLVYDEGKRALLELPEKDMTKLQRLLLAPPLGQDSHGPRLGAGADAFSRLLQRFPDSEIEELEQALLELPEEDMTKLHRLLWAPPMKKVEEWR